jgi:lysyl-tRNA synthetase class 1
MFAFKPSKISAHTAAVADFAGKLKDGMDAVAIHNLVFETAKAHNAKPGDMFTILYTALLSKEKGPRMGKLVEAIGPSRVKETLMQSVSGGK